MAEKKANKKMIEGTKYNGKKIVRPVGFWTKEQMDRKVSRDMWKSFKEIDA